MAEAGVPYRAVPERERKNKEKLINLKGRTNKNSTFDLPFPKSKWQLIDQRFPFQFSVASSSSYSAHRLQLPKLPFLRIPLKSH